MSDNDKIVHLKLVNKESGAEDKTTEESIMAEHEAMVEALMEDGPFEYMLGVARRRDGKFMTFGTSMDIRDYIFAVEFMKLTSATLLEAAFEDG
jgi:hypothetical protein